MQHLTLHMDNFSSPAAAHAISSLLRQGSAKLAGAGPSGERVRAYELVARQGDGYCVHGSTGEQLATNATVIRFHRLGFAWACLALHVYIGLQMPSLYTLFSTLTTFQPRLLASHPYSIIAG